jgi:hypothetical protein
LSATITITPGGDHQEMRQPQAQRHFPAPDLARQRMTGGNGGRFRRVHGRTGQWFQQRVDLRRDGAQMRHPSILWGDGKAPRPPLP